jgi:hypothetical protein
MCGGRGQNKIPWWGGPLIAFIVAIIIALSVAFTSK